MINNADCSLCVGQYEGCPPNKRLAITDHNGGRSQRHSCLDVNPPKNQTTQIAAKTSKSIFTGKFAFTVHVAFLPRGGDVNVG